MTAGKFRSALTALAGLTVTGVNHNYDVDAVPEKIARASLPILIVAPALDDTRRRKFGEFQVATPSGSSALVQYMVTHLLLYAPVGSGRGARTSLPGLVDLIDNYAAAIRSDPKLGSTLYLPTVYTVYVAPANYSGITYFACRFWHTFTIET
jgi:hypothetical protein